MTVLTNENNTENDILQNYCAMVDGIFGKLATFVRNEIRDTRMAGYTKNFTRFRDVVWCTSVQYREKPNHIMHKIYADIHSKTFQDDKAKLEFLQNTVNALSVEETKELPRMCRAYIIHELNARRRQCTRE